MEKDGNGSRFAFYQEKTNGEYLLWLHQVISSLGYCKPEIPVIQTIRGKMDKYATFIDSELIHTVHLIGFMSNFTLSSLGTPLACHWGTRVNGKLSLRL